MADGRELELPNPDEFLESFKQDCAESERRVREEKNHARNMGSYVKRYVKISTALYNQLQQRLAELSEKDVELKTQDGELRETARKLKKCNKDLETARGSAKNFENRLHSSEGEFADANTQLAILKQTQETLTTAKDAVEVKLAEKTEKLRVIDGENTDLENQLANKETEFKILEDKLKSSEKKLAGRDTVESSLKSAEEELSAKKDELAAVTDELANLENAKKIVEDKLKVKDVENTNLENQLANKETEFKILEDKLKSSEKKLAGRDTVESSLKSAEEELSAKKDELAAVTDELTNLENAKKIVEDKLRSSEEKLAGEDTVESNIKPAEEELAAKEDEKVNLEKIDVVSLESAEEKPGPKDTVEKNLKTEQLVDKDTSSTNKFAVSPVTVLPSQVFKLLSNLGTLDLEAVRIELNKRTNKQTWGRCEAALGSNFLSSPAFQQTAETEELGPAGLRGWERCKEKLKITQESLKTTCEDLSSSQQSNRLLNMEVQYYEAAFEKCLCILGTERKAVKRRVREQLEGQAKRARLEQQKRKAGGRRR